MHMGQNQNATGRNFTICLVLIFFLWELFIIINHVMWRDEWQAFLIARYSSSVLDLFNNARLERHPALWVLCLYLLKHVSASPIMMKLFHLMLAAGAIYIFVKHAPFNNLQKALFVFGYFPFFEYSVISRNYAIGVLCTFFLCSLIQPGLKRNYLLIAAVLFVLTQSSVYGLIIAIGFTATFCFEFFLYRDLRSSFLERRLAISIGVTIFGLGVAISLFQMLPPADSSLTVLGNIAVHHNKFDDVLNTFWTSYVPIPKLHIHFWNSSIITNKYLQSVLVFALLCYCLILMFQKPVALFFYIITSIGVISFSYLIFLGLVRHSGHLFVILIAALWISSCYPERKIGHEYLDSFSDYCLKAKNKFLYTILIAHLAAGLFANATDLIYPFSGSKEAANFLEENYTLDETILIGDTDFAVSAVGGYLNRRIFFPGCNRWGTFVVWDGGRAEYVTDQYIVQKAKELVLQHEQDALLIMNHPLNSEISSIPLVHKVDRSVVEDEVYYIYEIHRTSLN